METIGKPYSREPGHPLPSMAVQTGADHPAMAHSALGVTISEEEFL